MSVSAGGTTALDPARVDEETLRWKGDAQCGADRPTIGRRNASAIRDETDFARHVDYIHINPLKHGRVPAVRDWPYSSFHRHVEAGRIPSDWGGEGVGDLKAGEPG